MTDRSVILPTHSCFDDSLEFIGMHLAEPDMASWVRAHIVLCHGLCRRPKDVRFIGEGDVFAHAWLERLDTDEVMVVQAGVVNGRKVYYSMTRAEFETVLRPIEVTRYTVDEALAENRRTMSYGPWKAAYLAKCRRGGGDDGRV